MFTAQELIDGIAPMNARDPWERVHIRVRAFASCAHLTDRDWFEHMCAYADRVIAEELGQCEPDAGQVAQ